MEDEILKKVMVYVLSQAKGRFDTSIRIPFPDEDEISDKDFGLSVITLALKGYLNGFDIIDNMEFYPVEIREIFVNVSRKAEGFVE
jgi:hypothetical protein